MTFTSLSCHSLVTVAVALLSALTPDASHAQDASRTYSLAVAETNPSLASVTAF
jgi:hypothetical protein